VGDLQQYQQYQLGQAIPAAAENPAGGLAAAGVGLGMGMAYAGNMLPGGASPQGGGTTPTPAAGPPPPPTPAPTEWHIVENGQPVGPFTPAQLAEAVINNRVGPATLIWAAGMPAWSAAQQVPSVAALFSQMPPPPPMSPPQGDPGA
jgi:hypothetical protein